MDIKILLDESIKAGASDLHIIPSLPPLIRVNGDLVELKKYDNLSTEVTEEIAHQLMNTAEKKMFNKKLSHEIALHYDDLGHFRVSLYHQQKGITIALRIIPEVIPSFSELMLPNQFKALLGLSHGLIIISGPTGSGKSTTMAAMIDYINSTRACNIITIEDPIEYIHQNKKSAINQIQVGRDAVSFDAALRASLRQDPDVILVGEMRDLETIRLALTAADTGHLIITTLHSRSAPQAINRIIDVFSSEEKNRVRNLLAESIQAIIYQTLLKKTSGGRIAAFEIMVNTTGVRHLIHREMFQQIETAIQTGSEYGMCTLDQYIEQLLRRKIITRSTARNYSTKQGSFKEL